MKTFSVNIYAHVEFYRKVQAETVEDALRKAWEEVFEETKKINLSNFDVDDVYAVEEKE